MATAKTIVTMVGVLAEAFRQTPSEATYLAYEIGLDDVDDAAVKRAVHAAIKQCKFMPTVKELRELATGVKDADRSILAWDAVLSAPLNPYRHVDFDDGIINATIRNLGGWPTFIERFTDAESEKWLRKEFCETYSRLLSAGVNGDVCRPLAGLATASVVDGVLTAPIVQRIATGLPAIAGRIGMNTPRIGGRNVG